ncbi:hypothetical protein [Streptomyces sparsogenes]|uniref:hypothetical protein n=1 Tax=Streptomyces sparsogenes TaxID=67365 RepID=UPI003D9EE0FE
MPSPPISGGAAADRIADALGTPNVIGEKTNVTAFVVRRFVDRGLPGRVSSRDQWTPRVRSLIQIIEARRWGPAR